MKKDSILNLTSEEMKELVGGKLTELTVRNKNDVKDCLCTYKNKSYIDNKNTTTGCHCMCTAE